MWANLSDYRVDDQHAAWTKMAFLKDALKQHPHAKWVWSLDFDVVIMNPILDLGEYILNPEAMTKTLLKDRLFTLTHLGQEENQALDLPSDSNPHDINLLISHDRNKVNAGSLFLLNSKWAD